VNTTTFQHSQIVDEDCTNIAMSAQPAPTPQSAAQESPADQHEHDIENKEAFQYWGYLFKPDKTGSDKLKGLLRGLKDVMVCESSIKEWITMMLIWYDRMSTTSHPTAQTSHPPNWRVSTAN
jgi:hypothetical protein